MKTAIEKIFYGETGRDDIEATEEYKRLGEKAKEVVNVFFKSLNEEQRQQFDEIF